MKHTVKTIKKADDDAYHFTYGGCGPVKQWDSQVKICEQMMARVQKLHDEIEAVERELRQRKRDIYAKFPKTDEAVISIDELLGDAE